MKKNILVVFTGAMELGGIERSLLGLLDSIDYNKYQVDLFLYGHHGPLYSLINKNVNILPEIKNLAYLRESIFQKIKHGEFYSAYRRILNVIQHKSFDDMCTEILKHCMKKNQKKYDLALGFFMPFDVIRDYVEADVKVGWIHTDYSSSAENFIDLKKVYRDMDYIAAISEESRKAFIEQVPEYKDKTVVIENILSHEYVELQAKVKVDSYEILKNKGIKLLSIGRFCYPKNFDNIPEICAKLLQMGCDVYWYIIGFGKDEQLIKDKIKEFKMENRVFILGKKENPYPYINACDVYVQPSRYEGKSVTVREAQMLGKPVIITKYATSASQVEDGVDGVIVPMNTEECAKGIKALLDDKIKMEILSQNCKIRDYSNSKELEKIEKFIKE